MTFDPEFCKRVGCHRLVDGDRVRTLCGVSCASINSATCNSHNDCHKCMRVNWRPRHCVYNLERIMSAGAT